MSVKTHIELDNPSADFSVCNVNDTLHIITLSLTKDSVSSNKDLYAASNIFTYVKTSHNEEAPNQWTIEVERMYISMKFVSPTSNKQCIATRFLSKSIDLLEIEFDNDNLLIVNTILTCELPNMTQFIETNCYNNLILAWSFDGTISILKTSNLEIIGSYYAHNKYAHGVKRAICDPLLR